MIEWLHRRPGEGAFRVLILFVAFVLIVALLLLASVVLPQHLLDTAGLNPEQRLEAENDLRTTLLQGVAGAVLLAGLYFTGRGLVLSRSGQITERYTRAIDQLGAATRDVRMGGIYALERIARESPRDRRPISEVLVAFVRDRSKEQARGGRRRKALTEGRDPKASTELSGYEVARIAADVQAALTVLGRRSRRGEGADFIVDLSENFLAGAILRGCHLEGAVLASTHLEEADLCEARLNQAAAPGVHLERARLEGADLRGVILVQARLEGADLRRARLDAAVLFEAHLEGADLTQTTGLTAEQVRPAFTDERTRLPWVSG